MPGEMDHKAREFHLCHSCWQVFSSHPAWKAHANGPFADIYEASEQMTTLEPGDGIPAGVRVGEGMCWHAGGDIDPVEWQDIADGDLVWDDDAERFIGTVAHHDAHQADVEPPDGGSVTLDRDEFHPRGRYRAIRL